MKKMVAFVVAIVIVIAVCGGFYYVTQKSKSNTENEQAVTEITKLTTRDLSENYPKTPREVVKFYNRLIKAYYTEEYTDDEFEKLCDQALALFDDQLLEENPKSDYMLSVAQDVDAYKEADKVISQTNVCSSNDVRYLQDKDDQVAYVTASYFIKEGSDYTKTFQEYVLRQDSEGRWKILCFYKTEGETE